MKLVIHPAIDERRFRLICEAANGFPIVNCESYDDALTEIVTASAFFGKITPELLENAFALEWVQSPTASLEHYLFPELVSHACQLTNMKGLFYDVIADHVFGYITCIARNLHLYLRQQSRGEWSPIGGVDAVPSFAMGPGLVSEVDRQHLHLADTTIGVVGVGSIGAEICRRAKAFGMTILGVDPICRCVDGAVDDVWQPERLPKLLERSDFVVIAAPHTPATEKMFRTAQFEQMKSSAWLINIGRGMIVDLADLTNALQNSTIAGAALDVYETEPLPAEHPLWGMENTILTPHIAAASTRVPERHLETLLENIGRYFRDEPLINVVNKQQWF